MPEINLIQCEVLYAMLSYEVLQYSKYNTLYSTVPSGEVLQCLTHLTQSPSANRLMGQWRHSWKLQLPCQPRQSTPL